MGYQEVFTLKIHPAKDKPERAIIVLLFVILLFTIIYSTTQNVVFSFLLFVFLFLELRKFFFPTIYLFDNNTVTAQNISIKIVKPWNHFKSLYWDKNGLLLSPFDKPTRLENFRGFYIIGLKKGTPISNFVEDKIEQNGKS